MLDKNLMEEFLDAIEDAEVSDLGINLQDTDFKVLNKSQADFFLRQIKKLEEENNDINDFCDEQIKSYVEKTNNYRDKQTNSNSGTIGYFSMLLQQFADNELENNPKKRSIKLPFGTVGYKKSQDKLIIADDNTVMEFLKLNALPGIKLTQKESLDKKLIKSELEEREDGFYLGNVKAIGLSIEKGTDVFGVKIAKE